MHVLNVKAPYAHYAHLPYAREPWKSAYVFQRLLTTLVLVPYWALYYTVLPRRYRPRESWSIRQIINVNFTRRIYKITEVAGVTWGTRDPDVEPRLSSLKETRFEWVEPLPENLRSGIILSNVPFKRVGCYIWPQEVPPVIATMSKNTAGHGDQTLNKVPGIIDSGVDVGAAAAGTVLIGIFMHGGGYCHMSAHEGSRTSRIPRKLTQDKILTEVYSVEYRLLQHAPFPAVIQDAAAVYAHVVHKYEITKSKFKVILIGDSSGGNLVLSLARWLRDEGRLPMPDGLLLLSPSCDTSHALPETLSSYIPRPNASTDYLVDTPEPRALLQRTFLGFKYHPDVSTIEEEQRLMEIVHSEYVSPCSPHVLKRWGHTVRQDLHGVHEEAYEETLRADEGLQAIRAPENLNPEEGSPYETTSRFTSLFQGFPKTLIVVGDAERLVREVRSLQGAMEKDGIDVTTEWVKDAVHDVLIMHEDWWDREVIKRVWSVIGGWAKDFLSQ